jgi:hypothetical protein
MEEVAVICSPKSDRIAPETVGIWAYCVKCSCEVWLSDTSTQAVKEVNPEAKIMPHCISCGTELLNGEHKIIPPSEGQLKEIKNQIKNH